MTPNQQVLSDEQLCEALTTAYGSPEWTMDDVRAARAIESATLAALAQQAQEPVSKPRIWWVHPECDNTIGATWEREPSSDDLSEIAKLAGCKHVATRLVLATTPQPQPAPPVPAPVDEREAWLPIESAPKDGTSVFVWHEGAAFPGVAFLSDGRWRWAASGAWAGYPTHWQPLPPAPQATKGQP